MKKVFTTGAALLLTTSIASAGGIERSVPSVGLLYEDGTYLELNFGYVSPEISGTQALTLSATSTEGTKSGNMVEDYTQLSLGYKQDLSDTLSMALIFDQPAGADVAYPADTDYVYAGAEASVDTNAFTALVNYKLQNSMNLYGGVRAISTSGEVELPFVPGGGYEMTTSTETDFGYVIGAGWERPEIAARVSLTYHSEVTHDFDSDETLGGSTASTEFSTTIPQSVTLEAQTGVAADTLVFGSIRWVDWSEFDITPPNFEGASGSLVDYEDDTITYNVGVGRRFNDTWSGALTLGHEPTVGGFAGNLGPTDGNTALGTAVTYTAGNMKITGGVRYIWIGDAETEAPAAFPVPEGTTLAEFEDNNAIAAGLRIAYNF
ncbi:outer membrane protein transport protein [Loktanella agnita]|uniref:outer membrane protein transport protein n=1 Tax=Loktanella agnita TaxID=287097 RepID=UPI0039892522